MISSRYLTLLWNQYADRHGNRGTADRYGHWVTPSPSLTSTPTNTATVTPTLIPLEGTAFLQANANCRVGPGTGLRVSAW
ncbi:MAG: hypothetical protein M9947_16175 [Thermomicrobiales bacterium]|nr:hypothetical protein [Thermomicrobiales bacterium]